MTQPGLLGNPYTYGMKSDSDDTKLLRLANLTAENLFSVYPCVPAVPVHISAPLPLTLTTPTSPMTIPGINLTSF